MVEYPHGQVRAVTHYGVTAADIETTIAATRAALDETAGSQRRDRPNRGVDARRADRRGPHLTDPARPRRRRHERPRRNH